MRIEYLIKEVRTQKSVSLSKLAELSGISKGHLSKVERGEQEPKLSTMIKIAKALGVELENLYKIIY